MKTRLSLTFNKIPDMIGKVYGHLTVLGLSHILEKDVFDKRIGKSFKQKFYYLKCRCICENEITVTFYSLGRTTFSCGCVNVSDKRRKYKNHLEANIVEAFRFLSKNNKGNITIEQFKELSSLPCSSIQHLQRFC